MMRPRLFGVEELDARGPRGATSSQLEDVVIVAAPGEAAPTRAVCEVAHG